MGVAAPSQSPGKVAAKRPEGTGEDAHTISSRESLGDSFGHFFHNSSAAERTVVDPKLMDELVEKATQIDGHFFLPGGNSAIMAKRLAQEGCHVLLGGPVGTRLKEKLSHERLRFVAEGNVKEDVHLIMEYSKGEKWGEAGPSSRSNRYILNHGAYEASCQMQGMEELFAACPEFQPDIISLSGTHILEGCLNPI